MRHYHGYPHVNYHELWTAYDTENVITEIALVLVLVLAVTAATLQIIAYFHNLKNQFMQAPLIKNPITDEQRENLLCSAIEGGSNYWYFIGEEGNKLIREATQRYKKDTPFVTRFWAALQKGVVVPIHDLEDENGEKIGEISLESIYKGEAILVEKYPNHFADIVSENDDATTGDVWFQLASLGELVYG